MQSDSHSRFGRFWRTFDLKDSFPFVKSFCKVRACTNWSTDNSIPIPLLKIREHLYRHTYSSVIVSRRIRIFGGSESEGLGYGGSLRYH